ncbi:MAG: hypothetical protein ACI4CC_10050, partial [Lachnospiraceae bacterium]
LQVPVVAIPCGFKSHLLHLFYCLDAVEYDKVTVKKSCSKRFWRKAPTSEEQLFFTVLHQFSTFFYKKKESGFFWVIKYL